MASGLIELQNEVKTVKDEPYINPQNTQQIVAEDNETVHQFSESNNIKVQQECKKTPIHTPKRMPTQEQLCETVVLLKKLLPHRDLTRVITMLHQTLLQKCSPEQIYASTNFQYPSSQEVTRSYNKQQNNQTSFISSAEQKKYKEKRCAAKAFVANGYGLQVATEQFRKAKLITKEETINKDHYKQIVSTIVSQAFKKLQLFLSEECGKNIEGITKEELKSVMTKLVHPNHYRGIAVFKKFFRLAYGLSNVTLRETESVEFYEQVMSEIRKNSIYRAKNSDLMISESMTSFKNRNEYNNNQNTCSTDEIINVYTQCGSLSKTAQALKMKVQTVNNIIFRLIQRAIRRIQSALSNQKAQQDIMYINENLSNEVLNAICKSRAYLDFRIEILSSLQKNEIQEWQAVSKIEKLKKIISEKQKYNEKQSMNSSDNSLPKYQEGIQINEGPSINNPLQVYHEEDD